MISQQSEDEVLRAKLCWIFGVYPEELEFGLDSSITKGKIDELVTLISQKIIEARMDETSMWRAKLLPEASKAMYLRIEFDERITTLTQGIKKEES